MKKIWYIYTKEYYPAIRRNKTRSFVVMWMNLEFHIIKEIFEKMKRKNSKKTYSQIDSRTIKFNKKANKLYDFCKFYHFGSRYILFFFQAHIQLLSLLML